MTSTLTRSGTGVAMATLAGRTAMFAPVHPGCDTSPVRFTATVSLPLSQEDLVAALWYATSALAGVPVEDIDSDPASEYSVFRLVIEAVVGNAFGIADAHAEIRQVAPGTDGHDALIEIRGLVAATFGVGTGVTGR